MKQPGQGKKSNTKYYVAGAGGIVIVCFLIWLFAFSGFSWFPPQSSVQTEKTTFEVYSDVDGEDVSGLIPLSIWTPKAGADFSAVGSQYDMTKFEESTAAARASGISRDLSGVPFYWVELDPTDTTPFANNWFLMIGGNYHYAIPAYDPTTDVNFNVIDPATTNEVTVAALQTNGNYTIIFDCPHVTKTAAQMHYGTDWATSTAEYNAMTATQQSWFWDEMNYAGQYGLFNPNDFTYKSILSYPALAPYTDAFCFKLIFNTTASVVDGATTQVNFTISDDVSVQPYFTGAYLYLIYYAPVRFTGGVQQLGFEISFGTDIELSDIDSGNVPIQQSGNTLGTFVKLSDIAA